MKFYTSPRAPSPRRVSIFLAEKGITGLEEVTVSIAVEAKYKKDQPAPAAAPAKQG